MTTGQDRFRLTVLGSRGSIPIDGPGTAHYGGASSCYMVQAGESTVFLDGGSGLNSAPMDLPESPVILLSHLHLDHLIGLGMYPRLSAPGQRTEIRVPTPPGKSAKQVLDAVYGPPFWPVSLTDYCGDVRLESLLLPMQVGGLTIDGIRGNHPGGCMVFSLTYQGKRMIYATDFEAGTEAMERLAVFADGADLILFDAMYTEEDAGRKRGFGHSTATDGLVLMRMSGAKRLLLIHHDPQATDSMLSEREAQIGLPYVSYAYTGMVIDL